MLGSNDLRLEPRRLSRLLRLLLDLFRQLCLHLAAFLLGFEPHLGASNLGRVGPRFLCLLDGGSQCIEVHVAPLYRERVDREPQLRLRNDASMRFPQLLLLEILLCPLARLRLPFVLAHGQQAGGLLGEFLRLLHVGEHLRLLTLPGDSLWVGVQHLLFGAVLLCTLLLPLPPPSRLRLLAPILFALGAELPILLHEPRLGGIREVLRIRRGEAIQRHVLHRPHRQPHLAAQLGHLGHQILYHQLLGALRFLQLMPALLAQLAGQFNGRYHACVCLDYRGCRMRPANPPLLLGRARENSLAHVCQAASSVAAQLRVARRRELVQPADDTRLLHDVHIVQVRAEVLHRAQRVHERDPLGGVDMRHDALECPHLLELRLCERGLRVEGIGGEVADQKQRRLMHQRVGVIDKVHKVRERIHGSQVLGELDCLGGLRGVDDLGKLYERLPTLLPIVRMELGDELGKDGGGERHVRSPPTSPAWLEVRFTGDAV